MDLKRTYTMTFEAPNLEDADGTTGKQKQTDIMIDHGGQTVCYTVDVAPGQTQIDVSYDGLWRFMMRPRAKTAPSR